MKKKIKKLEKRVKELERVVFERSEIITTSEAVKGLDVVEEENRCNYNIKVNAICFMGENGKVICYKTKNEERSEPREEIENKPFDLTGLRVEVGNEENSRKLQEYAFKNEFRFYSRGKEFLSHNDFKYLFFDNYKIDYGSRDNQEHEIKYKCVHYNDIKHHIEGLEPKVSDITLRDAFWKVYGNTYHIPRDIKLNDFLNLLNEKNNG